MHAEAQADKDEMSQSDRVGSVIGAFIALLAILFFVTHSSRDTGFFTGDFGQLQALYFYLPQLLMILQNVAQAAVGRKNMLRPLEILSHPVTLVCVISLYLSFPFDFNYFPDVLPESLRFLVSWLSDGLVKFFMVIGIIVTIGLAIYTPILYISVREVLQDRRSGI